LIFASENLNVSLILNPNPDTDTGGNLWLIVSGNRGPAEIQDSRSPGCHETGYCTGNKFVGRRKHLAEPSQVSKHGGEAQVIKCSKDYVTGLRRK
jgi:hypothetical protein